MRLIMMGPPGVGKGTQARRLSVLLGVPAISTGELFRAAIAEKSALGLEVEGLVASGAYVPDSITSKLVEARLLHPDAKDGFILDGYPRTTEQVQHLQAMLGQHSLDAVLMLEANHDVTRQRLRGRADGRTDDTDDVISRRQQIYTEQTAPIVDKLRILAHVHGIDGAGSIEAVSQELVRVIKPLTMPDAHRTKA